MDLLRRNQIECQRLGCVHCSVVHGAKKVRLPGYDITQIQNCGAHGACTTETSSDQAANLRF